MRFAARLGFAYSAFAFVCFSLIGCSSSSSVEGSVTFDGKSVDDGKITFSMEAEAKRTNVVHGPITGGKYLVKSAQLVPGKYRVEIYWDKKTGKQIMSNDPPNKIDETIQVIPKQYNTASKEYVDLKAGANTHDFQLKSK